MATPERRMQVFFKDAYGDSPSTIMNKKDLEATKLMQKSIK